MSLSDFISTNTVANGSTLTAETFRAGWDKLREMDAKLQLEYGERVREVAARGAYKSRLGQLLDSAYIRRGPMIMHPTSAARLTEMLEAEERRVALGEEQQLSEDGALRIALAGWSLS